MNCLEWRGRDGKSCPCTFELLARSDCRHIESPSCSDPCFLLLQRCSGPRARLFKASSADLASSANVCKDERPVVEYI